MEMKNKDGREISVAFGERWVKCLWCGMSKQYSTNAPSLTQRAYTFGTTHECRKQKDELPRPESVP